MKVHDALPPIVPLACQTCLSRLHGEDCGPCGPPDWPMYDSDVID